MYTLTWFSWSGLQNFRAYTQYFSEVVSSRMGLKIKLYADFWTSSWEKSKTCASDKVATLEQLRYLRGLSVRTRTWPVFTHTQSSSTAILTNVRNFFVQKNVFDFERCEKTILGEVETTKTEVRHFRCCHCCQYTHRKCGICRCSLLLFLLRVEGDVRPSRTFS